jgi:hypothetical protein
MLGRAAPKRTETGAALERAAQPAGAHKIAGLAWRRFIGAFWRAETMFAPGTVGHS